MRGREWGAALIAAVLSVACGPAPPPVSSPPVAASASSAAASAGPAASSGTPASVSSLASSAGPPAPTGATGRLAVPVAVVMDNAPAARPESGIEDADIVWEILAEGFITRYLAIYASRPSPQVGPVRSARIYFDQLDRAYGIPLAHAGGNVDALNWIGTWHLQNLDEIYGSGAYFWRSFTRTPPDNLYTSTSLLEQAARTDRYSGPRPPEPAVGALPAGATATAGVSLNYLSDPPTYTYVAGWNWQGGAWVRTINGHVETAADGDTVRAGTVYILVVSDAPDPDPYTPGALKMLWSLGGKAWVLQGGRRVAATWAVDAVGLPQVTVSGAAVGSGGGPYWYEVVPTAADVTFR